MFEKAKEKESNPKFVNGGELSLGYYYESLKDLKSRVVKKEGGLQKNSNPIL
jgi:hypothetical protein